MSKAGKRLIAAARAMKEQVRDPIFADALETLEAIARVRKHLSEAWIVDSCREHQAFGCISCRALRLDQDLLELEEELMDDQNIVHSHGMYAARSPAQ